MRVMSWNVNKSANSNGRIDKQLEVIEAAEADVVLLQEVRYGGAARWLDVWREGLADIGLGALAHSCDWAEELAASTVQPHADIAHTNGHITAVSSEWDLERRDQTIRDTAEIHDWTHFDTHFPEKILVTDATTPATEIGLWNVRAVPGRSYGEEKIKIFETVYNRLTISEQRPRILAGDFNSPRAELPDGQAIPFGADKVPSIRDRWMTAELKILKGLGQLGLVDSFRAHHGYGNLDVPDTSWRSKRFDHIFASREMAIEECYYDHSVECSDHAPIIAEFDLA